MQFFVIHSPSPELLRWIGSRIDAKHGTPWFDPAVTRCTVLVTDDGAPVVATAIDGWTEHSCDVTIASDGTKRWATRKFLSGTYSYIFEHCGKNRMAMITAASNTPAIRMHDALGHIREGVHRAYFGPEQDAWSYSFLRADWEASRWYPRTK